MKDMKEVVDLFIKRTNELGWRVICSKNTPVIRIEKDIEPDNMDEYTKADMEAAYLLSLVPLRGGSVWGTESHTVGALSAIKYGLYFLNKSGTNGKRLLKKISEEYLFSRLGCGPRASHVGQFKTNSDTIRYDETI